MRICRQDSRCICYSSGEVGDAWFKAQIVGQQIAIDSAFQPQCSTKQARAFARHIIMMCDTIDAERAGEEAR